MNIAWSSQVTLLTIDVAYILFQVYQNWSLSISSAVIALRMMTWSLSLVIYIFLCFYLLYLFFSQWWLKISSMVFFFVEIVCLLSPSLSLSLYNMHSVFASCINIQNSFFLFHLHLVMNFFMSTSFILKFFEHWNIVKFATLRMPSR